MQLDSPRRPRSLVALVALVTIALVAAACGSDDPSVDDGDATAGGTTTQPGETTSGSTDDEPDDPTTSDGPATTVDDEPSVGDGAPGPSFPGQCTVDQVATQPFYAVANIEDDDPDGGLNVRDSFEDGEKLGTIPEGTVVLVEDCFAKTDGSVWYSIETQEPLFGWVNSAYLSTALPAGGPTEGAEEVVELVETVLDALAAKRWDEAAEALVLDGDRIGPIAAILDDGDDLATLLQDYCRTRLCDAPYAIGEARGSYLPARVRPEVDVEFTYSGGVVTQTFARIDGEDGTETLDTLPGQSVLAFTVRPPEVADVVSAADGDAAPPGLLDAAEAVRVALLDEAGPARLEDLIGADGLVVSTDAYVDPEPGGRVVVTADDLGRGDELRIWGYTDGVGTAIVDTVDGWFAGYRRSGPLLEPDVVALDTRVGVGNTIDNLAEIFAEARIIEFHRRGRGELADFNWSSVRMAFEQQDRDWVLVAIVGDTWTI